ncbi:MAG: DUF6528 family protein [Tannerella sp.]|jgi:hypothetical protein|nr:DUF6528 family protein [Tannerella sp.]
MKRLFVFIIGLVFVSSCNKKEAQDISQIVVCGDDKVLIIDALSSNVNDVKVVWEWKASDVASSLPAQYQQYLRTLDECKPVNKNKHILLTSSSGAVVLIDRATKKCLFYAHTPNAHSAEMLPEGKIAVALSTHSQGNRLELYDINYPEKVLFSDSLYSGHGAVWLEKRQRFYALGYDQLREYSLKDWDTPAPSLTLERKWNIPFESGHDLSPVSGDRLLVSGHEGVYFFDIQSGKFTPFEPLATTLNVKSVNFIEATGEIVYTKAEESWWTFNVYFRNPQKKLNIPDIKLYKVRLLL